MKTPARRLEFFVVVVRSKYLESKQAKTKAQSRFPLCTPYPTKNLSKNHCKVKTTENKGKWIHKTAPFPMKPNPPLSLQKIRSIKERKNQQQMQGESQTMYGWWRQSARANGSLRPCVHRVLHLPFGLWSCCS